MSDFILALEARTLFSALPVTKATLVADKAAVVADAATLKADLNILIKDNTTENFAIAKDFKGLPRADQLLLKTLVSDELKSKAVFLKDVALLNTPSVAAAVKSTAIGITLLTKANVKALATATKDIAALGTVTTKGAAALTAHLAATTVDDDRAAILAALPDNSALDAAVTTEQTTATADKAAIGAAATQLVTDIANLATDLTSVHTATGTFPSVVGTFTGTATVTAGKHKGRSADISLVITSEDTDGNLAGTVTDIGGGTDALTGTVSLNGVVALKGSPATVKVGGVLSGTTLTGSFAFATGKGTFTAAEVTG
jgi:hypothetical protein